MAEVRIFVGDAVFVQRLAQSFGDCLGFRAVVEILQLVRIFIGALNIRRENRRGQGAPCYDYRQISTICIT